MMVSPLAESLLAVGLPDKAISGLIGKSTLLFVGA